MKLITFFVLSCFLVSHMPLFGNANDLDEKTKELEYFYTSNYQEIVYIHTDKKYYLAGEHIKLKVYCLEKLTSKPTELSKVAYVEVLDNENNPQLQAKIELIDGTGYGEIYIPTSLISGNLILRAYTRWMRNYGPETYFHSSLTIINPFKKLGLNPMPVADGNTIDFYPESGSLINGVKTSVVFEGKNSDGYPIGFMGYLYANDTVLIKEFKPIKNGLGSFDFTPDIYNKYHVTLLYEDSTTTKHKFPVVHGSGFSMHVEEDEQNLNVKIFCNDLDIIGSSSRLYFILDQKGKVIDKNDITLSKGRSSFTIDKSLIEDGISALYVFNSEGSLLADRKVFTYTKDVSSSKLKVNKQAYTQRELAVIDVEEMRSKLSSDDFDYSVSVAATNEQMPINHLGITKYLLLENALNFVYDLESYFDGTLEQVSMSINNLLIAHHSSQNVWNQVEKPLKTSLLPEYRGPLITAKLKNKITGKSDYDIPTYLSIPGKNTQFYVAKTKSDGSLTWELKDFFGTNELVIQNDYTKDSIYSIELDDPFSRDYIDLEIPSLNVDKKLEKWITTLSQHMQVDYSYQKLQPKLPLLNKVDSSNFYHEPDASYNLDDFTRFIVMEEVMREYITGVYVRKNKDGFHFKVLDIPGNLIFEDNPLMLLDGVPVFDADEIIALDPLKIEKIETIKQEFHKGVLDCKGIVNYTTYDGDLYGYTLNKKALVLEYEGLQPRKQYYYPTYLSSFDRKNRTPDFRNTLYWNPQIVSNSSENDAIEFYTSDATDKYEIIIEGIDNEGNSFSGQTRIEVTDMGN